VRLVNIVPYCQNTLLQTAFSAIYTPTDCFFGDFAHWKWASSSLACRTSL